MFSKPLAFVLLALACVTAAAGGAYVATRHNTVEAPVVQAPAPAAAPATTGSTPQAQPVAETESAVSAPKAETPKAAEPAAPEPKAAPAPQPVPARRNTVPIAKSQEPAHTQTRTSTPVARTTPPRDAGVPAQADPPPVAAPGPAPVALPEPPKPVEPQPEPVRAPQFEELVLPASAVLGLQIETSLSSERARIEDRVEAHVTRDVLADGRVAIPAGARVIGSVTLVDKGGKIKAPARLGIRFHTLVLADGGEVALRTEPIYREGQSPANDSAKKIGGAAVVGAILGGIIGGGKGAVIGGTTGAGAGTAAVMAGDRTPATIPQGATFNVRLSAPATIQVEKR